MSIQDKRIKKEIDRIIKKNLKMGYVPTSNEVISELGAYISSNNLSIPSYKYDKIYSDFSADKIEKAQNAIVDDMEIIYESIGELYREVQKQINKFEGEKKKYNYRFNKLQSELLNLANKNSSSGYIDSFIENFSDMEGINLSKSDASIDLNNKEATLQRMKDTLYTDIKSVEINYSGHHHISIEKDLLDTMNKKGVYWKAELNTKAQKETSVEIVFDLGKVSKINRIEIEAPMIKPVAIGIKTSKDGDKWIDGYSGYMSSNCSGNMQQAGRFVKIILSKSEADKFIDGDFKYVYMIDTIKLFQVSYSNVSTIVTNPIKMNSNINKVSIIDNSNIPSGTSVRYFVALNEDNPEWIEINPINRKQASSPKVVTFSTTEEVEGKNIFIDNSISKEEYEMKELAVNGQKIYNITPNGLTQNKIASSKVFKGVNSWKREKLSTFVEGIASKEVFLNNKQAVETSYQNINPYRSGQILNGDEFTETTILKYTSVLECPDNDQVVSTRLVSNFPISLYLNGKLIYRGTPTNGTGINYLLKKRSNTIEAVININQINEVGKAVAYLDLGIDMKKYSKYIYANPESMTEVSLFNLRYNTNNRKDVYSVIEGNSGYNVLIKDEDLSINYIVSYEYITEDIDEVLVSAVLSKSYGYIDVTPRIGSFELRII